MLSVRLLKKIRVVGSRLSLFCSLPTTIQESACENSGSHTQVAWRAPVLSWVQSGTCRTPQGQSPSPLSPVYSNLLSLHFLFPKRSTIISPGSVCSKDRMWASGKEWLLKIVHKVFLLSSLLPQVSGGLDPFFSFFQFRSSKSDFECLCPHRQTIPLDISIPTLHIPTELSKGCISRKHVLLGNLSNMKTDPCFLSDMVLGTSKWLGSSVLWPWIMSYFWKKAVFF